MDSRYPELDLLYREVVLDHYRSPCGRKDIASPDLVNHGMNPICGDEVKVLLKMEDGRVADAAILSRGCAISVASGSMLADLLPGKTPADVERLAEAFRTLLHGGAAPPDVDLGDLEALEGVKHLPVRVKCALLPWTTLRDALKAWKEDGKREPPTPSTTEHEE